MPRTKRRWRRRFQTDPPARRTFPKQRGRLSASHRWADGGSRDRLRLLAMTVDEGVETTQRIGLLEATIGFDCRGKALVAKEEPNGFIFSRVRSQEQFRREMAERVGV